MTAARMMLRYEVPVDFQPHVVPLTGDPVPVAAFARKHPGGYDQVEFWCEHTEGAPWTRRTFQVFFTGVTLPGNARWVATCPRTPDGLIHHLYEIEAQTGGAA